ncbi:MAG TPA: hypothetical protein VLI69_00375 [Gammaproteobacteria bacterium]|nr:hypothetical protein [Gammaproteobacteria bacterium]
MQSSHLAVEDSTYDKINKELKELEKRLTELQARPSDLSPFLERIQNLKDKLNTERNKNLINVKNYLDNMNHIFYDAQVAYFVDRFLKFKTLGNIILESGNYFDMTHNKTKFHSIIKEGEQSIFYLTHKLLNVRNKDLFLFRFAEQFKELKKLFDLVPQSILFSIADQYADKFDQLEVEGETALIAANTEDKRRFQDKIQEAKRSIQHIRTLVAPNLEESKKLILDLFAKRKSLAEDLQKAKESFAFNTHEKDQVKNSFTVYSVSLFKPVAPISPNFFNGADILKLSTRDILNVYREKTRELGSKTFKVIRQLEEQGYTGMREIFAEQFNAAKDRLREVRNEKQPVILLNQCHTITGGLASYLTQYRKLLKSNDHNEVQSYLPAARIR